ncbi:response regulator [Exilibacterium tricleocarpae]|uniref:histidine kinase n=1 Tax=Exilibacterium tricleocarpae TaxID=2591008 RepID=A0A545SP44_9GAMM|nr:ATP-binding protein [Exilibacterium tricleocarpae]TQV66731.1 response regulator [Exilibacterium tricleocarpae]
MRRFRDWSIRSKLACIAIVPVLISVALLCISFMKGYLDLKNRALPSQRIALVIADRSYSYLSWLRKYAAQTDAGTLATLEETEKMLRQYVSQFESFIEDKSDSERQSPRQMLIDVGDMLAAGRQVIQLSDSKEAVIENSEESEEALIDLLARLTAETNRSAEQILAINDTARFASEILPTLNVIAELSALGHALLSEIREYMLQPNPETRREIIEFELGLQRASQRLSALVAPENNQAANTAGSIENMVAELVEHSKSTVEQRASTQTLLDYLDEKEQKLESTILNTVELVENQVRDTQAYLLTMMIGTAAACALLSLLWGLLMAKSISSPVLHLKAVAQRFGEGKSAVTTPLASRDEIGALSRAFSNMMERINKANQSLEQEKSYHWNIVQSMQDALFVVNQEGLIERVNQATLGLLDFEENRILGRPLADFIINGKAATQREKPLNPIVSELADGDIIANIECIAITRKNHRIPVSLSGAVMHGSHAAAGSVVCVIHDLSAHVRAEELAEARDKAEAANQAKTTFLSRMSHELRTPMNAILGFAQLQERKFTAQTPDASRRINRQILSAGWHLLNLIDELLDLVQIERNTLKLSVETCHLHKAVNESLNLVLAQNIKPDITVNYEEVPITVMADYTRLKQILINLLSNAIKYNRDRGSVTIHARPVEEDEVEISISDTGVGITPENRERIFEPFTRLQYAEDNEIQGTGIGLSLTKFLVEQMNGSIRIDSHIGHGTVFMVRLKRGEAIATAATTEKKSPSRLLPLNTDTMTVLYVEDNPHSVELMQAIVDAMPNIALLTSATAEEGIELAKHFKPALILLDINLPNMDGISAVRVLRRDPVLQQTRIIALSADAMPTQIEEAMRAGFDQYITKPINVDQIIGLFDDLDPAADNAGDSAAGCPPGSDQHPSST